MTLVALKVAHFPDDSSPDGVDICQWGREGLEAFLLGGESHMGSRARDTLNAASVPTSQLWREANFVWPLSPSLRQHQVSKIRFLAGFLGCGLQGPLERCLGNLNSYIGYRQAKVAMETLHPFPDLQSLLPPWMLHSQLLLHTRAGRPHRAR